MYNLKKFNHKKIPIQNYMPFGRILYLNDGSAMCVCKDGGFLSAFRYRGPDLGSAIPEALAVMTAQLNNVFMTLGTGWVLYFEAQRRSSTDYGEDVYFPDPVTKAIDNERKEQFQKGENYESSYYLSIYWLPPSDRLNKLKQAFIENHQEKEISFSDHLDYYLNHINQIFDSFKSLRIPEAEWLTADELVTYLHSTVSGRHVNVKLPKNPLLLDALLYDTPLAGELEPQLGKQHLAVVVPLVFPGESEFGMFDVLNQQNFSYRWVTRFYCLDKQDALAEIGSFDRGWRSKIKPLTTTIRELITGFSDPDDVNVNAIYKIDEIKAAEQLVESDAAGYGFYSTMLIIMDENREIANNRAKDVVQKFLDLGLRAKIEDLNAVDAWFGSIPGNVYNHVRHPFLSTGNLTHMTPITDIWAGPARNQHLKSPALLYTRTIGNTPFRLNIHVGDVGHCMLIGPTGAGKSVQLCLMMAQFRKYKDARVFIFDKGASFKILTLAAGGRFYDLANEDKGSLSFQPLVKVDEEKERMWASEWICDFIRSENVTVTPGIKKHIWTALTGLAAMEPKYRTLSSFKSLVQDKTVKEAISPLTVEGAYGNMFDSNSENLTFASWQTFEMEALMNTPAIVSPTLMYIFHRIEQALDGAPTVITLDECWVFFDNPAFADKIREWLKVLRKSNASVVFATQSLADITDKPIFATIIESCRSKIFLPNQNALESKNKQMYEACGLNSRQIQIIAEAKPKKDYYYTSEHGSRLYDLDLGPVALAYCAVNKVDQVKAKQIVEEYGAENFAGHWGKYKGLNDSGK
ncbi:MAG: conjugal transfer protein TrbE [Sporomusaceae bacterium]|nr:conjugal transfer protein TrbE [Sporomusaceae bacterium]